MLIGAALLSVALGAAAAVDPIAGAFGLDFGQPVPEQMLGASVAVAPYPMPPANLDQSSVERAPNRPPAWYLFTPDAKPDLLEASRTRFLVMLNDERHPLRIQAEHPNPSCTEDLLWFTRSLARKYRAETDPYGVERPGFDRSARFTHKDRQVDVSCGPALLVEYTDAEAYRQWIRAEADALAHHRQQEEQLKRLEARLERERARKFADSFTAGARYRLEGVWGVTFGRPFDGPLPASSPTPADEPFKVTLPDPGAPFEAGEFTLTLGPDQVPIRLSGTFVDANGALYESVAAALRAKYGNPLKDSAQHKIHKVNGDHLIARYDAAEQTLHMTFINGKARRAQKARALLAQQQQFEEETAGL